MNGNELSNARYIKKISTIVKNAGVYGECLTNYGNYLADSRSYSTVSLYIGVISKFLRETNKPVEALNIDDYSAFLASTRDRTSSYQIYSYEALRWFSIYLKASNRNTQDPMRYKIKPKKRETIQTIARREKGFLTDEEVAKYISNINTGVGNKTAVSKQASWMERDKSIVLLFLNTGMRCSALWKLDVSDIDFENNKLVTIDKGEKIQEYVLSDVVMTQLRKWCADREIKMRGFKNDNALFISNRRVRMTNLSIYNVVKKYASNINGKNITPHKLRATAITDVYERSGGDIYMAQKFAGHSSPSLTANIYVRGESNEARAIGSDIMGKVICGVK